VIPPVAVRAVGGSPSTSRQRAARSSYCPPTRKQAAAALSISVASWNSGCDADRGAPYFITSRLRAERQCV
jgi:hypothetical protein